MTKLEKLIEKLCPDGVEYKEINDCTIKVQNIKWKSYVGEDKQYIDLSSVDRERNIITETQNINADTAPSRAQQIVMKDDIIFGTTRPMLKRYCIIPEKYDGEICSTGFCVLRAKTDIINPRWLYHNITTNNFFAYVEKNQQGASYPSISDTIVKAFKLPVPPLEVQREIVRILDNFTFLTTELAAELAARQKQYEYYRDLLLTFKPNESTILNERTNELELSGAIRWMKLGDIGSICMCKRILKSETNQNGGIPFYKIGTFGKQADAYISNEKFIEYKNRYKFPKKGDILISAAGTIGRTVVYDGKPAYFQDSNIVWIDNDETRVLNTFLNYWYSTSPWVASAGGTISRLYNDNIAKAPIPVPSLEVQQRIVGILDRFDALCNDISSGLPAEIEMRQKQYEYYRDKLLTFKELKKEA